MKIWIKQELCNLCKLCVKACVYNAIHWDQAPIINENCIFCGVCVQKCPQKAIILEGEETKTLKLEGDLWVYLEKSSHGISENSLEIISRLNCINQHKSSKICGVLIGSDLNPKELESIRQAGAERLYVFSDLSLSEYHTLNYTDVLNSFCRQEKPMAFIFPASEKGRDLAPRLATVLHTGLTADCTELGMDELGLLVQTRPAFSGDLMASIICPYYRPQMATVRSHSYRIEPHKTADNLEIIKLSSSFSSKADSLGQCKIISREPIIHEFDPIEYKKIVISVGRGINSEEQLKNIISFARCIDAGIGCSRPIVDKGWLPQSQQVGMSGKAVAPKLYIALGISGSVQHLSGIQSAEYILAVNRDEQAPIFKMAHMGMVGDINKLLPEIRKWVSAYIEKEK